MTAGRASSLPAGRAGSPVLEATSVTKRFGRVTVLGNVSVKIGRGEIVALVGETGAGKSTLVACVARILEAEAGLFLLNGAPLPASPDQVRNAGVEVLWQDHGLCDDLTVVANIFLGRETGRIVISESEMREAAAAIMRRVGAEKLSMDRPVRTLSRGQRQLVAFARALQAHPQLLILDEPTASLGVSETIRIQSLIREARDSGVAVLLITHDLDQVFGLADRIVVLREGQLVGDVSPPEVHRDDIVALMSGMEMDSMARRQLHRLRSLVDQLSDVEPAASLPLIVSAMAVALDQEMLCVHLLEVSDEPSAVLRRSAAVGLPDPLLEVNDRLPLGPEGGCAGLAAASGEAVVVDDLSAHPAPYSYRMAAAKSGVRSEWATPIVGTRGVLGTVTGFATSAGRPQPAQLELARVYLGYAASAIERERLLAEVSRRNRILESLRKMLEVLAGPERVEGGLGSSLSALSQGLGADEVAVLVEEDDKLILTASNTDDGSPTGEPSPILRLAAVGTLGEINGIGARFVQPGVAAVPLRLPQGRAALVALWRDQSAASGDTLELLDDATRSLALAAEGAALERARRETAALRRSQSIQRNLLSSLSHELRTPLTAIQGYASTLQQPDLTWDAESTERFLQSITTEAGRMERLVGDLLDSSAIESGILRLQRHWCDLRPVLDAAVHVVADGSMVELSIDENVEPVWADHDRLEQVFVNLLENALSHGYNDDGVIVWLRAGDVPGTVEVEVRDQGPGIPAAMADRIFEPRVRGSSNVSGAGLGLPIARGIVEAHGGTLTTVPVEVGSSFLVRLPNEPPADAIDGSPDASWSFVEAVAERDVV